MPVDEPKPREGDTMCRFACVHAQGGLRAAYSVLASHALRHRLDVDEAQAARRSAAVLVDSMAGGQLGGRATTSSWCSGPPKSAITGSLRCTSTMNTTRPGTCFEGRLDYGLATRRGLMSDAILGGITNRYSASRSPALR